MQTISVLFPNQIYELLLQAATERPVFIWGPPGIGKSSVVSAFAKAVGMDCVTLPGSQLAPEDLMGVPRIIDGHTHFCPPAMLVKEKPFVLFLDELNLSSAEVLKAFYSLILEKRVGELVLPQGSVVVAAGNRQQDVALVRPLPSALINRMVHVEMKADAKEWIPWAKQEAIHPWILGYLERFPHRLSSLPSKSEEPFSTPRSWHALSDVLTKKEDLSEWLLEALAFGLLSLKDAQGFLAFVKQLRRKVDVYALIKGQSEWPKEPNDRDLLLFMTEQLLQIMVKELPENKEERDSDSKNRTHRYKVLLKELADIDGELLHNMLIGRQESVEKLPDWFLFDISRDLPRLLGALNRSKSE